MPGSASATSPRPRMRASRRYPRAAALQGLAKMRAQPGAGAGAGVLRAAAPPQSGLAGRARRRRRQPIRALIARGLVGLVDVDRQRRDRLARAGHRRRALPPDRRQPRDDAAPRHEWPDTLRQLRARLRRRARTSRSTRPSRPASATRARPTTCGWLRAHGAPGVEIFVYGRAGGRFPGAPARAGEPRGRAAARARSGARAVRRAEPRGDRRGRVPQRCRRGRQRARAVRARAGLRRPRRRLRRDPRGVARGRDRRSAGQRGEPRRGDPHLPVQRAARHAARAARWR